MYIFWLVRFRLRFAPTNFFFFQKFSCETKNPAILCDRGEKFRREIFENGGLESRSVQVFDAFTERVREIDDLSFPLSSRRWESRRSRRGI